MNVSARRRRRLVAATASAFVVVVLVATSTVFSMGTRSGAKAALACGLITWRATNWG